MGEARVSGARENVKAKAQLLDPTQSLVVSAFENAELGAGEADVAVDVVKDAFFNYHRYLIGRLAFLFEQLWGSGQESGIGVWFFS